MKNTALITGGSRGIGLGIAKALVKEGYRVAINGVRPIQQIKETLNDLKADGGEVIYCQGDIGNSDERKKIVEEIKNQWGHLHVLVNNAAYQGNPKIRSQGFENLKLNDWNQAIDVNLTGVFLCCQTIGKQMLKQKTGNIINIASTYGLVGPDQRIYGKSGQNSAAFYAATKSAIVNLTRYLAAYWQKTGIRVNTLSPGGVQNNQDQNFQKKYSEKTMIGRMAKKDEYVGPLLYLASDASSYMTGSNLIVDGGWTAW